MESPFNNYRNLFHISQKSQKERPTMIIISKYPDELTIEDLRQYFLIYGSIKDYFIIFMNFKEIEKICIQFYKGHSGARDVDDDLEDLNRRGFELLKVHFESEINRDSNNELPKILEGHVDSSLTINELADDNLSEIFEYLSMADKFNLRRVCRRWNTIVSTSLLMMKRLDLQTFMLHLQTPTQNIDYKEQIQESLNKLKQLQLPLEKSSFYCTEVMEQSVLDLVTSLNMHLLAMKCEDLSELIVRSSTDNEHILSRILMENQNLEYIEIVENKYIRGESLLFLSKNIHTFVMDSCRYVESNLLCAALKRLKNLEYIKLICSCGYEVLTIFDAYCYKLEYLEFQSSKSGPRCQLNELLPTRNLRNLKHVRISECDVPIGSFCMELSKNCPDANLKIDCVWRNSD